MPIFTKGLSLNFRLSRFWVAISFCLLGKFSHSLIQPIAKRGICVLSVYFSSNIFLFSSLAPFSFNPVKVLSKERSKLFIISSISFSYLLISRTYLFHSGIFLLYSSHFILAFWRVNLYLFSPAILPPLDCPFVFFTFGFVFDNKS